MYKLASIALLVSFAFSSDSFIEFDVKSKRGDKGAVVVVLDVQGMNSACHPLVEKNLSVLKQSLDKSFFNRYRVSQFDLFTADREGLKRITSHKVSSPRKLGKLVQKLLPSLKSLHKPDDNTAKDLVSVIRVINQKAKFSYRKYAHLLVILLSDMRSNVNVDSLRSAHIELEDKLHLTVLGKQGASSCQGATLSQELALKSELDQLWNQVIEGDVTTYWEYE
jgi:hypothetical protein